MRASGRSSEPDGDPVAVTPDEVLRIAALARLQLDRESLDRWVGELNGILAHVERLAELDTDTGSTDRDPVSGSGFPAADAEPYAASGPPAGDTSARSPDGPGPEAPPGPPDPDPLPAEEPGESASRWRDGFFLVPRIPGREDG